MAGKLFVVATPLGNLQDISARALDTLRSVAVIACEDTRRTVRLLSAYEIHTPLLSCHRFNEHARLGELLHRLTSGTDVALVSDGGTPVVSDPGAQLVRAAIEAGIVVVPVPGVSAVTALVSISGLAGDRFVFEGFLPHRQGERRRRLRELRGETRPIVLFESPHRIRQTLDDVERVFGERQVVLAREMTKLHETILRGTPRELNTRLEEPVRGEITLMLSGASSDLLDTTEPEAERALRVWRQALEERRGDRREALRTASRRLGLGKAALQRLLMELGEEG